MDILKVVYQVKPDIIVLASGDSDFISLIQEVRKSGIRVEVAAFEETAGAGIMSKCSGFIDLAVYYDGYLAAQNGEEEEESLADQFKDLIQSQNGEQGGESIADQYQELMPTQSVDPNKDTVKLPVHQVENQIPDITDELSL